MAKQVTRLLSHTLEALLASVSRPLPSADALARARIVSHRGERDAVGVLENTMAAFDRAAAAGVPALEFDIRFTRDDEPVIAHDPDLKRVFRHPDVIAATHWRTLRRNAPRLPHLADFMARYAERAHLMLELKTRGSQRAERRLADLVTPLRPVADFHVLALDTALFEAMPTVPARARLPVARLNLARLHAWALANECAGLAGSFALLRRRHIRALKSQRHFVGSGLVDRPAVLMREIARGVEWIFSNHAVGLQQALDTARGDHAAFTGDTG